MAPRVVTVNEDAGLGMVTDLDVNRHHPVEGDADVELTIVGRSRWGRAILV